MTTDSSRSRRYWLIVESRANWLADQEKQFCSYGFPASSRRAVERLQQGDLLITYISKSSSFSDVREVCSASPAQIEGMPEYSFQEIRYRIDTRPIFVLDREAWIPVRELLDHLALTKGKKGWSWMFRTSLKELEEADGKLVLGAIQKAVDQDQRQRAGE